MQKITVKVDGMQCGMCEAHVNDAVRAAFPVKKVTSSHSKKETVIITDTDIPEEKIKEVIKNSGYDFQHSANKQNILRKIIYILSA